MVRIEPSHEASGTSAPASRASGLHTHSVACSHAALGTPTSPSRWAARLGTISGVVCLVHCLATPLLIGLVALLPGVAMLHGPAELFLLAFTLVMAWISVGPAYRAHHRFAPLALLICGTVLAVAAQPFPEETSLRQLLGLSSAGLLVASIWVNRAYVRSVTDRVALEPLVGEL